MLNTNKIEKLEENITNPVVDEEGFLIDPEQWTEAFAAHALMLVQETTLDEFHEYSVEWVGENLIFRLDGVEIYRNADQGSQFPEPMFAVLNFAKINASAMSRDWVMEVDWVKHEYQ